MSRLFELLEKIRTKPGMYLGRPSVSDLFMFLVGYEYALSEIDIDLTEAEKQFYCDFQPWLQQKLKITSVASWAKLIMLSCHDEKAGFEQFYKLLDEFKQCNPSLRDGIGEVLDSSHPAINSVPVPIATAEAMPNK
uniref:Uncharacterized protein n=1 Tax=Cyanothece sp. (strain PCC 7425 / ATCC 29141) TaxID=395961 RepID=B8HQL0_CYAP4